VLRTGRIVTPDRERFGFLRNLMRSPTTRKNLLKRGTYCFLRLLGRMSTAMLLNHSETDRKKGVVRGRESRNQSLNTKLSPTELAAVEVAAATDGCALGEWVRDLILRELPKGSASDPSLAEIIGVRLLLVNVLRPLAAGQRLTPEAFGHTTRRNQWCETPTRQQVG
jgi:hypothetical protein